MRKTICIFNNEEYIGSHILFSLNRNCGGYKKRITRGSEIFKVGNYEWLSSGRFMRCIFKAKEGVLTVPPLRLYVWKIIPRVKASIISPRRPSTSDDTVNLHIIPTFLSPGGGKKTILYHRQPPEFLMPCTASVLTG